jgi:hypothetical protein
MFEDDLFGFVLEQLADEMAGHPAPEPNPIATDSWIARSILQKAIRRGLTDLALRAAATLLTTDQQVLWKRLIVTAMEDQGVGEIDYLARVIAAFLDPDWRSSHGGEWAVAAHLVTRACGGTRCQAANDLVNIAKNDPDLDAFRASLCDADLSDLLSAAIDEDRDIAERAVAILIATGEDAGAAAPTHINADPNAIFGAFTDAGWFGHVAATYRQAYRLTGLALAPLSLALWRTSTDADMRGQDDDIPGTHWIGDVPGYALDQYTRTGKAVIRDYTRTSVDRRGRRTPLAG